MKENILDYVFLGDCQELLPHILEKIDRKKVILVSDPPFNIGYHYGKYNDNLDEEEYYEVLQSIFQNDKHVIIHYPEALYKHSFQIGRFPERVISWVYNSNTARQHRDIAFFGINPDFSKVKQPYKNTNDKRIIDRIKSGSGGANLYDWFEINQIKNVNEEKTKHPCQMPLKVMENIIGLLPDDAIIIDPFCGSGTTLLAVKTMNEKQQASRRFIGIEIDEEYFNIAINRLNNIMPNGQTSIFTDFDLLEKEDS